jgi:hypothetical protein
VSHGEVLVSHGEIEQFRKIDDLRSITDHKRDQFLPPLAKFLAARELDGRRRLWVRPDAPYWLRAPQ